MDMEGRTDGSIVKISCFNPVTQIRLEKLGINWKKYDARHYFPFNG